MIINRISTIDLQRDVALREADTIAEIFRAQFHRAGIEEPIGLHLHLGEMNGLTAIIGRGYNGILGYLDVGYSFDSPSGYVHEMIARIYSHF